MTKEYFQYAIKRLKVKDKFGKSNKEDHNKELKKEQEIEQEYERRKKEAAKQLIEGMEALKKKPNVSDKIQS